MDTMLFVCRRGLFDTKSLKAKLQGTQLYTASINFLYIIKAPYLKLDDVGVVGDTERPCTESRNVAARMINGLYYFFETGSP